MRMMQRLLLFFLLLNQPASYRAVVSHWLRRCFVVLFDLYASRTVNRCHTDAYMPRDLLIAIGAFGVAVYVIREHPDFFIP